MSKGRKFLTQVEVTFELSFIFERGEALNRRRMVIEGIEELRKVDPTVLLKRRIASVVKRKIELGEENR